MAKYYTAGPVYLDVPTHTYIHKVTGKIFTSVTKVLSSFEEEFDIIKTARAISKQSDSSPRKNPIYIGLSEAEIIAIWKKTNDDANIYGTLIHETIEKYLINNKWYFPESHLEKTVIKGYDNLKIDEGIELWPERILFSEKYKLAGMTDLLIDIDDKLFDIGDWKSNRVINFYSPYKKFLLPPFEYLSDCQYNVYSLQLSVYALMYEMETGKKCRSIWIGYWDRELETIIKIPIMYLKHEAKKLLEFNLNNVK